MNDKSDLLELMLKECDICIHLHGKLPEGGLEYRPSPVQRSTLELLRYLSFCGLGFTRAMVDGDWTAYKELEKRTESMTADDFPARMDEQKTALVECFEGFADGDLSSREATLPWGGTVTLGRALLDLPFRCLVGYRMQLFLYAKAAGNHALNTPNCWAGVDVES